MLIRFVCLAFLCVLIAFFTGGCITERTVKEDGEVIEQGYVIKDPLLTGGN
ncbi:MAG: hypothetical protein ABI318_17175 [Chthoniobacteraceae bacterium]